MSHHAQAMIVTTTTGPGPAGAGHVQVQQNGQFNMINNVRYQGNAGRILGIIQLCLGVVSVICGIITVSQFRVRFFTSLWCGCIYMSAGILGIVSPTRKTQVIVGFMVMSIIAALVAPYHVGQQIRVCSWYCYLLEHYWFLAFHPISAVAGFVEFIIAIVSAAYCCKGATCCKCCWSCCCECCCGPPAAEQTMTVQYGNQLNPTVSYGNQPSAPYNNQGFMSV